MSERTEIINNSEIDYKRLHADFIKLKTKADTDNGRRETLNKELQPKLEELRARLHEAPEDLKPLLEALLNGEPGADEAMKAHLVKRRDEMMKL